MSSRGNMSSSESPAEFWQWLNKSGIVDEFVFAVVRCLKDKQHIPPKKVLEHIYSQLSGGKTFADAVKYASARLVEFEKEYSTLKSKHEALCKRLEIFEPNFRKKSGDRRGTEELTDSEKTGTTDPEDELIPAKSYQSKIDVDPNMGRNESKAGILKGERRKSSIGQVRFKEPQSEMKISGGSEETN